MARPAAVHVALDLAAMPALASAVQRASLPPGVLDLIKIAAGCPETRARAVVLTGERPEILCEAAAVYLQTALLFPAADSYRILGVTRDAPQAVIRLHFGWLMKWLHPDRQPSAWQASLAERVLGAWDQLKSPQRRASYDRAYPPLLTAPRSQLQWRRPWLPWITGSVPTRRAPARLVRRLAVGFVVGLALLTIIVGMDWGWRVAWPQ